ncbi:helix-turn-helix transcriptional regulator [Streptomyces yaizuensis]|uniref:Helix-turn-helix domain-containing protein n=1 Tax=Streptomyces yaizuensis TaxID=2989713 RepID=A0ABQ5NT69_9ACTN|nr:helix-turn-helix transcriptional regulator [Streptomyces sp. YSPA8]GLF93542.1 helix-turn-helix domain-containing protein [Streptomyces sp. YSPA8]
MSNATGRKLKEVRKRRGLSQKELASASDVSLSLIRKLEQGDYGVPRLESMRKLAVALGVPTMRLVDADEEEAPTDTPAVQWDSVRAALENPAGVAGPDDDGPTLAGVWSALQGATPLYDRDQYAELARVLPSLLRDSEALGTDGRPVRTRVLRLAGALMIQTNQYHAADIALTRSIEEADDQQEAAAAVNSQCWLLLRQGKLDSALQLATGWADATEPRISRAKPSELSTWGLLCLRVSASAVRNNQKETATDALKFAKAAASALGREYASKADSLRTFGPTTVHLMRTENYGIMDSPDMVLRLAERTPLYPLRPNGRNQNRHLLDIAHAHTKKGDFAEAFTKLEQVRATNPDWLSHQRYARDVLTLVLNGRRILTPEMRAMADFLSIPL